MLCPERARLLVDYRNAAHRYSECVHDLVEDITLGLHGLHTVRIKCAEAWERAEKARLTLARHEASHFCDRPDFVNESASV